MQGAKRLLGSPTALQECRFGFNRPLRRAVELQWQRHLSAQSPAFRRPPTTIRSPWRTQRRYASSDTPTSTTRVRNALYGTGLVLILAFGYFYITDTRASV